MATATYKLEVDWDASGTYDGGDEDVTSVLKSLTCVTGRRSVNVLSGEALAGELVAELGNEDDRFNSFNASSPLTGDLLPGRDVRLSMTSPVSQVIWTGKLRSIKPKIRINREKRAEIRATGPLADLVGTKVRFPMSTSLTTGALVDDVLDAADYPSADRDIDTGNVTVTRFWADEDRDALGLCRELEGAESGWFRETFDGKIKFEDSTHRQDHSGTSQATFSDAGSNLGYEVIEQIEPINRVYNEIRSAVVLFSTQSIGTLWTHPEANTGGTAPLIGPGETKNYWARYPNPASATQAVAVDAWTTPVSTTDYTANAASDGTGTDLTSDISVVATKFGDAMKIAVTNGGTGAAYLTLLQARGTAVYANDPVQVDAEDATSQSAYGRRVFEREAKWVPTTELAQGWCDQNLEIFKDPQPAIRLIWNANKSNTYLTHAAQRAVSERVTVDADGAAGLGFDQDFFIERIRHTLQPGGIHEVEYLLSSTAGLDEFWVLGQTGSTELGQATRANYG